ncbi:hypothetical protein [Thiohalorhabdus sp.]|uniref:hypothetical protein n=1 Tax=Thiohalorhabdus sp. TaxID=3094134 RepID=UPI002FC32BB7
MTHKPSAKRLLVGLLGVVGAVGLSACAGMHTETPEANSPRPAQTYATLQGADAVADLGAGAT